MIGSMRISWPAWDGWTLTNPISAIPSGESRRDARTRLLPGEIFLNAVAEHEAKQCAHDRDVRGVKTLKPKRRLFFDKDRTPDGAIDSWAMYGTLLIICKIVSDALAATFGMLGLLFDFKDDQKKVTRTGRIALIGILASFMMSGIITGLEAKKSHDEAEIQKATEAELKATYERSEAEMKAATQQNGRKVMKPLDSMSAEVFFSIARPHNFERNITSEAILHAPHISSFFFPSSQFHAKILTPKEMATKSQRKGSEQIW